MERAILFVSFGVSDAVQRRACLDSIVEDARGFFSGMPIRQAYTSGFIRKRLQAEGLKVPSLQEALQYFGQQGVRQVLVQPTHLTPGEEFDEKIVRALQNLSLSSSRISLGTPVFSAGKYPAQDRSALQIAIAAMRPERDEVLVFMGHGSPHRHNPVYEYLQQQADELRLPVQIGVLEDTDWPSLAEIIRYLRENGTKKILLRPLLLTGGRHVDEDMAGASADSWKSRLQAAGFSVRVGLDGLGSNVGFRAIYLQRLRQMLEF